MDWFAVFAVLFSAAFILFIFLKCHYDDKKERKVLTKIYRKYGVKTTAEMIRFHEHDSYGRYPIPCKYEMLISFRYQSPQKGEVTCMTTLWSNHPDLKKYQGEIPIILIPQFIDYTNELINREELIEQIGCNINVHVAKLLMFSGDMDMYTDLCEADFPNI